MSRTRYFRRGMLVLGAIVLIAILGVVMLTTVSQSLQTLRQQRREDEVRQAQYLAEAAAARAVVRAATEADYTGEEIPLLVRLSLSIRLSSHNT